MMPNEIERLKVRYMAAIDRDDHEDLTRLWDMAQRDEDLFRAFQAAHLEILAQQEERDREAGLID